MTYLSKSECVVLKLEQRQGCPGVSPISSPLLGQPLCLFCLLGPVDIRVYDSE